MCTDADAVACPAVWRWMLPRADDRGLFRALQKRKTDACRAPPLCALPLFDSSADESARNRRRGVTSHHTQPVG